MEAKTKIELLSSVIFASILVIGVGVYLYFGGVFDDKECPQELPQAKVSINHYESTEEKIVRLAKDSDVLPEDAIRIAICESSMGKELYNLEGSSAKGIFMFIDSTWEDYCDGDVLNAEDNIKCFLKLYPDNKDWWVCK